jgi:hypothetical protein
MSEDKTSWPQAAVQIAIVAGIVVIICTALVAC